MINYLQWLLLIIGIGIIGNLLALKYKTLKQLLIISISMFVVILGSVGMMVQW